jgi:hypothetical protein
MGRTARRVLGAGAIAVLLALTAVAGVADRVAADATSMSPPRPPGSLTGFVAPAPAPLASQAITVRSAADLMLLVLACSAAVAFFSERSGEPQRARVPARVRRR